MSESAAGYEARRTGIVVVIPLEDAMILEALCDAEVHRRGEVGRYSALTSLHNAIAKAEGIEP